MAVFSKLLTPPPHLNRPKSTSHNPFTPSSISNSRTKTKILEKVVLVPLAAATHNFLGNKELETEATSETPIEPPNNEDEFYANLRLTVAPLSNETNAIVSPTNKTGNDEVREPSAEASKGVHETPTMDSDSKNCSTLNTAFCETPTKATNSDVFQNSHHDNSSSYGKDKEFYAKMRLTVAPLSNETKGDSDLCSTLNTEPVPIDRRELHENNSFLHGRDRINDGSSFLNESQAVHSALKATESGRLSFNMDVSQVKKMENDRRLVGKKKEGSYSVYCDTQGFFMPSRPQSNTIASRTGEIQNENERMPDSKIYTEVPKQFRPRAKNNTIAIGMKKTGDKETARYEQNLKTFNNSCPPKTLKRRQSCVTLPNIMEDNQPINTIVIGIKKTGDEDATNGATTASTKGKRDSFSSVISLKDFFSQQKASTSSNAIASGTGEIQNDNTSLSKAKKTLNKLVEIAEKNISNLRLCIKSTGEKGKPDDMDVSPTKQTENELSDTYESYDRVDGDIDFWGYEMITKRGSICKEPKSLLNDTDPKFIFKRRNAVRRDPRISKTDACARESKTDSTTKKMEKKKTNDQIFRSFGRI